MPQINTLLLALALFVAPASALPPGIKPKPPQSGLLNPKPLDMKQLGKEYGEKVALGRTPSDRLLVENLLTKNLAQNGLGGLSVPGRKNALQGVKDPRYLKPNMDLGNAVLKKNGQGAAGRQLKKNTKANGRDGLAIPAKIINAKIKANGGNVNTVAMEYPKTKGIRSNDRVFFTSVEGAKQVITAKAAHKLGVKPTVQLSNNVQLIQPQNNAGRGGGGRHRRGEMPSLGLPPKQAAVAASSAAQPAAAAAVAAPPASDEVDTKCVEGESGPGVGSNWCNTCTCIDGAMTMCTKKGCGDKPTATGKPTGKPRADDAISTPASRAPHPWVAAATPTGGNAVGDEVVLEEDLAFELFFEGALTEEEAAVISQILNEASAAGEMDIELGGNTFQPTAEVLTMPAAAFYAEHPEFAASAVDDAAAGSKSNAGAIAAAVVALLVLMVAVVGSVAMYLKKRRSTTTAAYAATIDTTTPAVALATTAVAHGGAGALPYPCLSI